MDPMNTMNIAVVSIRRLEINMPYPTRIFCSAYALPNTCFSSHCLTTSYSRMLKFTMFEIVSRRNFMFAGTATLS